MIIKTTITTIKSTPDRDNATLSQAGSVCYNLFKAAFAAVLNLTSGLFLNFFIKTAYRWSLDAPRAAMADILSMTDGGRVPGNARFSTAFANAEAFG